MTMSTDNNVTRDNATLAPNSGNVNANDALLDTLNRVQVIITPTLLLLGITGNLLVIVTVSGRQFGQLSTTKYTLKALAVSDSVLLLTNVFNQRFLRTLFDIDLRALSTGGCKVFFFAYRVGKMSASWCIVLVALERFVAVWFPFRVRSITTKRNILAAILCVYVIIGAISGVWAHVSTEIVEGTCRPDAITRDNAFVHKVFVIVGGLTYSLVPILILLVLTPPIVHRLLSQRRRRRELTNNAALRLPYGNEHFSRVTAMLVGIVLWYIVCVIPITLVLVLTFWTNKPIFESQDPNLIVFLAVAQTFEQINHSSNFFIYVLLSRQFRDSFLQKVSCKKYSQPQSPNFWSSYLERIYEA